MDIYHEILTSLQHEESVMLATIISTSGSTPTAALSKMLVKRAGTVSVGTVGGGCMEGNVLHAARKLYQNNKAEVLTFQLDETNLDQGLICGGTLDILIEPLTRQQTALIKKLRELRDAGEDAVLATFRSAEGTIAWKHIFRLHTTSPEGPHVEIVANVSSLESQIADVDAHMQEEVRRTHQRQETRRLSMPGGELFLEPVLGAPSLIIFGGGHVSTYLSKAASMAGFQVTIVDDRQEYSNPQRFPEAVQTLAVDFLEAFDRVPFISSTYVAIVTRGHRSDEEILERAVKTPAKYIGMIGSKRKVFATYEHLIERGTPIEWLKKVYAPIGLEIGAVSAEEVAVSIIAEIIAVRRGVSSASHHESGKMKEMFRLLEEKTKRLE